jgi:hypothetical protein
VAIFQHSLPFLQSESFQTHVGTIHHRAIGPLAHHNGTSAYSPSLTCHLPAPTIGCLHSNDSLTTLDFSRIPKYHSNMCLIVASVTMLLTTLLDDNEAKPPIIVTYLRKHNVVLSHCYNSVNVIEPREPHTCNNTIICGIIYSDLPTSSVQKNK